MTDESFAALRPGLQPIVDALTARAPVRTAELPEGKGLYALCEGDMYLYVGITRNLRRRWQMHRYGDANAASFAIKLARENTQRKASYKSVDGLRALLKTDDFREAFGQAKARIRKMNIRFIEWENKDDDDLAILEMYAAKALGTAKYNDFKTR